MDILNWSFLHRNVGYGIVLSLLSLLLSACSLGMPSAASANTKVEEITPVGSVIPLSTATKAQQPATQSLVQPTQQVPRVVQLAVQPTACALQTNWPVYTVQANDTLGQIASRIGTNAQTLAQANCLADMNTISVGAALYVPVLPVAPVQPTQAPVLSASGCTARALGTVDLLSWGNGTGAYAVAQLPSGVVLTVNEIIFNGYVSLTYNGTIGWADPRSVVLSGGDCAHLLPADFNGCLLWLEREDYEFNLMTAPESGQGLVMFPARVWVYAFAYRPYRVGDSEYYRGKGWYRVRLPDGVEGWIPDFVGRNAGNCGALPES